MHRSIELVQVFRDKVFHVKLFHIVGGISVFHDQHANHLTVRFGDDARWALFEVRIGVSGIVVFFHTALEQRGHDLGFKWKILNDTVDLICITNFGLADRQWSIDGITVRQI